MTELGIFIEKGPDYLLDLVCAVKRDLGSASRTSHTSKIDREGGNGQNI
jgi:hypothetical protein